MKRVPPRDMWLAEKALGHWHDESIFSDWGTLHDMFLPGISQRGKRLQRSYSKKGAFHVITYNVDSIPHRYLLQFSPFHVSDYVWGYTNSQSEKLSAAHHSARVFPLK